MRRRAGLLGLACLLLPLGVSAGEAATDHSAHRAITGEVPASSRSIWTIPGAFTDQRGERRELSSLRGAPTLLAFFYGTCDSVCPVIVRDLQKVEALLPAAARTRTRFVLVTIDPGVDTPAQLRAYAEKHALDPARWTLLHGSAEQVRVLANVLGVKYRPTGTGQWSHTIRIILLDADGVVVEHYDGLERPLEPIAARTRALLPD